MLSLSHCQRLGIIPTGSVQSERQAEMASEMERWGDVIQRSQIEPA